MNLNVKIFEREHGSALISHTKDSGSIPVGTKIFTLVSPLRKGNLPRVPTETPLTKSAIRNLLLKL